MEGDLSNKESIAKAIDGSYAVFGVTNYWESMDASLEIQQGKNLADAVKVCYFELMGSLDAVY